MIAPNLGSFYLTSQLKFISPECCIICLVYINRLIAFTGMPLHPTNWRPLVLCSLLVAQKVKRNKENLKLG